MSRVRVREDGIAAKKEGAREERGEAVPAWSPVARLSLNSSLTANDMNGTIRRRPVTTISSSSSSTSTSSIVQNDDEGDGDDYDRGDDDDGGDINLPRRPRRRKMNSSIGRLTSQVSSIAALKSNRRM